MSNKVRSTDSPYKPPPHLILSREDARNAPGPTYHCGFCEFSSPETDHKAIREHRCENAAGRDMTEIKRLHAEARPTRVRSPEPVYAASM